MKSIEALFDSQLSDEERGETKSFQSSSILRLKRVSFIKYVTHTFRKESFNKINIKICSLKIYVHRETIFERGKKVVGGKKRKTKSQLGKENL
jgi:hypothetical protein